MTIPLLKQIVTGLVTASFCLTISACSTTKAPVDRTANSSPSLTPQSQFTRDGLVAEQPTIHVVAVIVIAKLPPHLIQGHDEFPASLGVLVVLLRDDRQELIVLDEKDYQALDPPYDSPSAEMLNPLVHASPTELKTDCRTIHRK